MKCQAPQQPCVGRPGGADKCALDIDKRFLVHLLEDARILGPDRLPVRIALMIYAHESQHLLGGIIRVCRLLAVQHVVAARSAPRVFSDQGAT